MLGNILRMRLVKMCIQKVIGSLPSRLAFSLNEASVRMLRGQVQHRFDTVERANKGLSNLRMLQEDVGFEMSGANVLELGTGWHGIDIILFHLLGAASVVTVDHWSHLRVEVVKDQIEGIYHAREELDFEILGQKEEFYNRLDDLRHKAASCPALKDLLAVMGVSYRITKHSDVSKLNLVEKSVDLFYTESVLQRIPDKVLFRIVNYVGNVLLTSEGVVFARTDQKDIHTQDHVAGDSWGLEYLKYSDPLWNLLSSEKLNWQNRLRESDFVELFENSAMHIVKTHSVAEEADVKYIQGMRLAKRFRGYDLRDIAVRTSIIVAKRDLT